MSAASVDILEAPPRSCDSQSHRGRKAGVDRLEPVGALPLGTFQRDTPIHLREPEPDIRTLGTTQFTHSAPPTRAWVVASAPSRGRMRAPRGLRPLAPPIVGTRHTRQPGKELRRKSSLPQARTWLTAARRAVCRRPEPEDGIGHMPLPSPLASPLAWAANPIAARHFGLRLPPTRVGREIGTGNPSSLPDEPPPEPAWREHPHDARS